jgi:hypothetical protein
MENAEQIQDLDLDLFADVRPGRRAVETTAVFVREIRPADLALLASGTSIKPISVKKLTERHHGLARLLASGVSPGEAAIIMGYEGSRVSILQGDPAFEELIEFYRDKVDLEFSAVMGQIAGLSKDLILELRDRLEDDPEKFSIGQIRELLGLTLDRSGFGPTHKQVTDVNINLSSRLDMARERARAARLIDITPEIEL